MPPHQEKHKSRNNKKETIQTTKFIGLKTKLAVGSNSETFETFEPNCERFMSASACMFVSILSAAGLKTYGSQLVCNAGDDKRGSDWCVASRHLRCNSSPAWVVCVCGCGCG